MNLAKLREPFPETDVEWRIQRSGFKNSKPWALVLAYVTNRAIQQRLDEVCGPENWQNEYKPAPSGEGVLCGIGIRLDGWVWKWDGAENTQFEAVKGGLSASMKRAAVQWGIGRYLYDLEAGFADFNDDGRYRDKVKDESTGQEKWLKWNPPRLPTWAVSGASPIDGSSSPKSPPSPPAGIPAEEIEFLKDDLLIYLDKSKSVIGEDAANKLREAVARREKEDPPQKFAEFLKKAINATVEEVKKQEALLAAGKNPMAAAVGKLAQAAKESGKASAEAKQGGLIYDHE